MSIAKLGKFTVTLVKPASFATRTECRMALGQSAILGLCASLNACWSGKALKTKWRRGAALDVGADTLDELIAIGIPEAEIYAAGGLALELVTETPREQEVTEAETFIEAQTEG
jgi:hypothetical protein